MKKQREDERPDLAGGYDMTPPCSMGRLGFF